MKTILIAALVLLGGCVSTAQRHAYSAGQQGASDARLAIVQARAAIAAQQAARSGQVAP